VRVFGGWLWGWFVVRGVGGSNENYYMECVRVGWFC